MGAGWPKRVVCGLGDRELISSGSRRKQPGKDMICHQTLKPKWCRRCRDLTNHEVYEVIPSWLFWSAVIGSLGIAYPLLASIQHRSPNRCAHCDACNNGRYFEKLRRERSPGSRPDKTRRRVKRRRISEVPPADSGGLPRATSRSRPGAPHFATDTSTEREQTTAENCDTSTQRKQTTAENCDTSTQRKQVIEKQQLQSSAS